MYKPRAYSRSWRGETGSAEGGVDVQMEETWGWTEGKWKVMLSVESQRGNSQDFDGVIYA